MQYWEKRSVLERINPYVRPPLVAFFYQISLVLSFWVRVTGTVSYRETIRFSI